MPNFEHKARIFEGVMIDISGSESQIKGPIVEKAKGYIRSLA